MEKHKHTWIGSTRGCAENPGCWDTGNGALRYRSACACGACREKVESYCGRGGDHTRIIHPGEMGWSEEDVQTARGAAEEEA